MRDIKPTTKKKYQLGILLVHGIGTQRLGETLGDWGDRFIQGISWATKGQVEARVTEARVVEHERTGSHAEATIEVPIGVGREKWLVCEAWWAESFLAPTYKELVQWSVSAIPWVVSLYVAQRFWLVSNEKKKPYKKFFTLLWTVAKLITAFLLSPILIFFLLLILIIGILPIPSLRSFILSAQGVLVASVGDSLAFVQSPIRAARIKTKALDTLALLKKSCKRTIIIAHSQGAAVVMDALGGINYEGKTVNTDDSPKPDTLITFGSGINQLSSLRVKSSTILGISGTLAVIATIVGSIWLYFVVQPNFQYWIKELGKKILISVIGMVAIWTFVIFFERLPNRWKAISLISFLVIVIGGLISGFVYRSELETLVGAGNTVMRPFTLLVVGVVGVLIIVPGLLSKELKRKLTLVNKPKGLNEWFDFYSSADPVPNGATRAELGPTRAYKIFNVGSSFSDHTWYWKNLDGFLLRVIRICANTADCSWKNAIVNDPFADDRYQKWRLRWLEICRFLVMAAWCVIGPSIYYEIKDLLPDIDPPRTFPAAGRFIPYLEFVALGLFGFLIYYQLIWWSWLGWVKEDEIRIGKGEEPEGSFEFILLMISLTAIALRASVFLIHHNFSEWMNVDWTIEVYFLFFLILIICYLFRFRKNKPSDPESELPQR